MMKFVIIIASLCILNIGTIKGQCPYPYGCFNDNCNPGTAVCKEGCKSSYYGDKCDRRCSYCNNYECTSYGLCTTGCASNNYGGYCDQPCPRNCQSCTDSQNCTTCYAPYYGTVCDTRCPNQCIYNRCDKVTGQCNEGCKDGYTGDFCENCLMGYYKLNTYCNKCQQSCESCSSYQDCGSCKDWLSYGTSCQHSCSPGCRGNGACHKSNGNCYLSCKAGYKGFKCDQCIDNYYMLNNICHLCPANCIECTTQEDCSACTTGYYGQNCQSKCSSGCETTDCAKADGSCDCKDMFTSYNCKQCADGRYGDNCDSICPINCVSCLSSDSCHGCKDGWYGTACQTSCSFGCDGGCNKTSGACLCKTGYSGDKCCVQTNNCALCSSTSDCYQCYSGYYGVQCQAPCPNNCEGSCNKANGDCNACSTGLHGSKCQMSCPENCDGSCVKDTGDCNNCKVGFFGSKCADGCPPNCVTCDSTGTCSSCKNGFYGTDCSNICPTNCVKCFGENDCTVCESGYYGNTCGNMCRDNCISCTGYNKCTQCKDGLTGPTCSQSCQSPCSTCLIGGPSACTSCIIGRYAILTYLFNGIEFSYCNHDCSKYCVDGFCENGSGSCTGGCVNGYTGDKCGCPTLCRDTSCSDEGKCYNDNCDGDYIGSKCSCIRGSCVDFPCNTTCHSNTLYASGDLCCKCPTTCRENTCSDADTCLNGCVDGFHGDGCQRRCYDIDIWCLTCADGKCNKCLTGYFPYDGRCTKCSTNCLNGICSSSNGTCLEGCADGFWGSACNKTCSENCKICDRSDGRCTACDNDRYRRDCSSICSERCLRSGNVVTCDIDNGSCNVGCTSNIVYGDTCQLACNTTCSQNECNWQTGKCTKGCEIEHHGEWCENKCSENCINNSSSRNSSCASTSGTCHVGCNNGYFNNDCETMCGANCINATCDRQSGACSHGCADGFEGSDCAKALGQSDGVNTGVVAGAAAGGVVFLLVIAAVVVVVLFMRRRRGKKADNTDFSPAEKGGHTNIAMDDVGPVYTNSSAAVNMNSEPSKPSKSSNKNQTPHISLTNSLDLESDTDTMDTVEARRSRDLAATANQPLRAGNELALPIIAAGRESPDGEVYADQPIRGEDDGDTYYNAGAIRRVAVDKLADYVANKSDDDFKQEFGSFPKGLVKPYGISQMPGNVKRNRYNKVYPYDENRVKLQNATCDYINASYIDGFERKNEYIAALGPTKDTTDYFATVWSMIWQQNVEKLVMLTNLQEGPKMKCHQYWPHPGEGETYGDVTVTCMAEDTYAEYTVRTLSATKDREKRVIYHLHYTGWPDRGVPDDVTGLIEFRNKVLRVKATLDGPVLVHCSAGVGRTGTYIALDYLTNEGEETESVDVFELVSSLRQQRIWMVQAEEQYVYLHDAVVHTLTYDSRPIHSDTFQEHIKSLTSAKLKRMYSHLKSGHSRKEEDEVKAVAKNKTYKNKNNPAADIPGDRYRPRIHLGRTQGECDYINAVYLNSFRFRNHYIVAQTPLSSAVDDFLTLLFQEHIPCIVDMQPHHKPQKNIGEYLPADNQEVTHGDFAIRSMKVKSNNQFTMRRLIITRNSTQGPEERIFHHYQCVSWQDSAPTPPSHADFINFVREVEAKSKEDFEDAKILIHCLTGSGRSCLFPAVSVMLQKMESEQEVSVVNTVRQIQSRRPGAIPDKEQYLFCHECIRAFLDSFDTYSNFAMR